MLFDWRISAVCGRGFRGAQPPGVSVTLVDRSGERQDVVCSGGQRDTVGDLSWRLESPPVWTGQVIKLRITGVGSTKITEEDPDNAQKWISISDGTMSVRLVLAQMPSKEAERERRQRRVRLERMQLQLEMMRSVPSEKLVAWEERRASRCASIIQRSWRIKSKVKTQAKAPKKRTDKLESPVSQTKNRLNKLFIDEDDFEKEGCYETFPTQELENVSTFGDDALKSEEEKAFGKRMQELDEYILKEAVQKIEESKKYTAHENYQILIEQSRSLAHIWDHFEWDQTLASIRDEKRQRQLQKCDRLDVKLGDLKIPLQEYAKESIDPGLLSTENGTQGQEHLSPSEESKGINKKWKMPTNAYIQEQAVAKHLSMLENFSVGKDWWRVRLGYLEKDIRDLQSTRTPWKYPYSLEKELGEEERDISRWWISFASKNPATADAILDSSNDYGTPVEVFDEAVNREASRIVSDFEQKLKSSESPLLAAVLSCPPHRFHKLREVIRMVKGGKSSGVAENDSPSSFSPKHHVQRGAITPSLTLLENESGVEREIFRKPKKGKRPKDRKKTSKKEIAMAAHIEALEEQVAILRAHAAQRDLASLKTSIIKGAESSEPKTSDG